MENNQESVNNEIELTLQEDIELVDTLFDEKVKEIYESYIEQIK